MKYSAIHYFPPIWNSVWCNQYWAIGLDCPYHENNPEDGKMPEGYFGSNSITTD
jgi:hypothetical protein